jgi:hypothetical protein
MFKEYNEMYADEQKKQEIPVHNLHGGIRQANQGKYEWRFEETDDKTCVVFEIKIPKFMETAHVGVDV